jgi:hypothetical protein
MPEATMADVHASLPVLQAVKADAGAHPCSRICTDVGHRLRERLLALPLAGPLPAT